MREIKGKDEDGKIITITIPDNIRLFTGVIDKNGKDIYEGDIVKKTQQSFSQPPDGQEHFLNREDSHKFRMYVHIGDVRCNPQIWYRAYDKNNLSFDFYTGDNTPKFERDVPDTIEIIGNIKDNPELIN